MSAAGARIVEVKRRLDGSEERFECELVHRTPALVVVCLRVEPGAFGLRSAAAEGTLDSYGLFWRRRPYNCYHMVRPESGEAVITRFDVLRDVEIDVPGEVRYTDLFLDLRIEHGAARRETVWQETVFRETVLWEDEDEVAAAARAGLLSPADRGRIDRARAVLDRGHTRITAEVRRLLRSLGRLPA